VVEAEQDLEAGTHLGEGSVALRAWKQYPPGKMSYALYGRLKRADGDKPSPAVLSMQGGSGGSTAAITLPNEPRRFSIGELRIICGFPEDFELIGTYAERWARLGNAVPPLMMREVASVLRDGLLSKLGRTRAGFIEAR
jgi:DNA (cytosine-5)-methyltransferase 1